MTKKTEWLVLAPIVAIILYRQIVPLGLLIKNFPLNDFSIFLAAAKLAVLGENPYPRWYFDRFNYPPVTMIFFYFLGLLSTDQAEFVFSGLSVISLFVTVWAAKKSLNLPISTISLWLIFSLLWKTFPAKLTLSLGQTNLIVLGLVSLSFYFMNRNRQLWSGIYLGLASSIKMNPALMILYFLFRRKWVALGAWAITLAAGIFLGVMAFGWNLTDYYYFRWVPSLLKETTRETINSAYMNQSITAFLARMGVFGFPNTFIRQTLFVVSLGFLGVKFKKMKSSAGEFLFFWLMAGSVMLFFPVFVWQHHHVFLLPIWIFWLYKALMIRRNYLWVPVVVGYAVLNFYFPNADWLSQKSLFLVSHFLITAGVFWIVSLLYGCCLKKN